MVLRGYGRRSEKPAKDTPPEVPVIDLDQSIENADWAKTTWDLPYTDAESLRTYIEESGQTVEDFKQLPIYTRNVGQPGMDWLWEL